MAGQPIKRALQAALAEIAVEEMGAGHSALDYVCDWIEDGGRVKELQEAVEVRANIEVTQQAFSRAIRTLEPDARDRIAEARRRAPPALVERARDAIEDAPTDSREKLDKAKETAKILLWQAERLGKETYGQAPMAQLNLNVGQLHLEAFRAINQPARGGEHLIPVSPALPQLPAPGSREPGQ